MDAKKLPLPPNSSVITFTNFDLLESVARIEMVINGIPFKRLHERGMRKVKPCWLNNSGEVDGRQMLTDEKQVELEAIFKNYCLEYSFSIEEAARTKRISKHAE